MSNQTVNKDKYQQTLMVLRNDKFGQAYEATLPMTMRRYMPIDKAVNIVGRAIQKNPKLLACDPRSIQQSMIDCAALGLELAGPLQQAHLVPFWDGKQQKSNAVLIIGFGGYLELMRRTGEFDGAPIVQWVYSNDIKKVNIAAREPIEHTPCLDGDRGHPLFVYILCWFKSGGRFFDFRTFDQVIEHRNRYVKPKKDKTYDGTPWDEKKNLPEFLEMGKKTMIRLSQKHLPKNTEMALAAEYEANVEAGQHQPIVEWADMAGGNGEQAPQSRAEQVKKALEAGTGGNQAPETPTPPAEETTPPADGQEPPPPVAETKPSSEEPKDTPPPAGGMWEQNVDELEDMPIEVIKEQALKAGLPEDTFIELKEKVGIKDGARGGNTEGKRKKLIFEIRTWLDTRPLEE